MTKYFLALAQVLTASMLMALADFAAAQSAYPSKPIRFIVPYPPGGTTTAIARLVSEKLTESWGQQVLVDNRGGGNAIIGAEAAAKSAPDGYTILLAVQTHVVVPSLLPTPYDPIKDFAPIATVSSTEMLLVVHPSLPARNLREFIALAKSRPGELNYASSGNGSPNHLSTAMFENRTGVRTQHIPYKGGGPAMADFLGGQVQFLFQSPLVVLPFIKAGKIRPIAISGKTRLPSLPQVPTFTEAGLPDYDLTIWYGVLAPAATPKDIVNKLATEIARLVALPDVKQKLSSQGQEPFISTPDQFGALMKADFARFARIIKTANIKLDN